MTPPTSFSQALPESLPFADLWGAQPRALRIFDSELRVLWDNIPEQRDAFRIFRDGSNRASDLPRDDQSREEWPVELVRRGLSKSERLYRIGRKSDRDCVRVKAWRAPARGREELLIVEEMEKVACEEHQRSLEQLDQEVDRLVLQMAQHLEDGEVVGGEFRLHLSNPRQDLDSGHVVYCKRHGCRYHNHPEDPKCWDVEESACDEECPDNDPLAKIVRCNECEVFRLACPDPLTRLIENFNRLLLVLQLKSQEALRAQQQLQQADKLSMLGELLGGIAHQIQNPLGIIMGRIELLTLEAESIATDDLIEDLRCIHDQASRMSRLVSRLLGIARPALSEPSRQSINELVRETLTLVRKTLEDSQVELETNLTSGIPHVFMDAIQMQQVLLNLIINARDAMPGGGRLAITTEASTNGKGSGVRIRVEDEGVGIPPEKLEEVFRPFYTTKLERGGTGLGLAVCRRIMNQFDGEIVAERRPSGGTTMNLWLPAGEDGE